MDDGDKHSRIGLIALSRWYMDPKEVCPPRTAGHGWCCWQTAECCRTTCWRGSAVAGKDDEKPGRPWCGIGLSSGNRNRGSLVCGHACPRTAGQETVWLPSDLPVALHVKDGLEREKKPVAGKAFFSCSAGQIRRSLWLMKVIEVWQSTPNAR